MKEIKSYLKHKRNLIYLLIILLLLAALPAGIYLSQQIQIFKPKAYIIPPLQTDFESRPVNLLKFFGQKYISETSRNVVSGKGIYHAAGVHVDRSSNPNKVYIVDAGNNRILGYNGAGVCSNNSSQSCTIDSDCDSGNTCTVDGSKGPDIVFGQSDLTNASCNKDNNKGILINPGPDTLCFTGHPYPTNIAETWTRFNIDSDNEGNLYIPDRWNNRVLKYNQPFSVDKSQGKGDNIADFVWGQGGFNSGGINYGPTIGLGNTPTSDSLFLSFGFKTGDDHVSARGVSVDKDGNVWVADTFNHRVLRFPKDSGNSDLVIGQPDFISNGRSGCNENAPFNQTCTPMLARVNPETNELYVLDEYPAPFLTRILVFRPPFTNGMRAYKTIKPRQINQIKNWGGLRGELGYGFQSTGFIFNSYKEGEYANGLIWLNEYETFRTLLIDSEGNIIKIIGAPDDTKRGGDQNYLPPCDSIYNGFNLWWPGGSIGMDSANNIYLADERFHRISRYKLPYNSIPRDGKTCLPEPNGGLFPGTLPNVTSIGATEPKIEDESKFGESIGVAVFQNGADNQLIVQDEIKLKVWNDYLNKPSGSEPNFVINSGTYRVFLSEAIDNHSRLWMPDEHGVIKIYQLPFKSSQDKPLKSKIKLYWLDTGEKVHYGIREGGVTFNNLTNKLYIADKENHRVLRVSNYSDINEKLYVDLVLGQPDKNHTKCNFNQEMPWVAAGAPSADSLCNPVYLKFDKQGNMYVIENSYECHGNTRITFFTEADLANASSLFPRIQARRVFNANSLTQKPEQGLCRDAVGKPGSPVSIAFNSRNEMVIGNDGYYGDARQRYYKQLWYYSNPIERNLPDDYINIPMGSAGDITFDNSDNLIIQDHTWSRVWILNFNRDLNWLKVDTRLNPPDIPMKQPEEEIEFPENDPTIISSDTEPAPSKQVTQVFVDGKTVYGQGTLSCSGSEPNCITISLNKSSLCSGLSGDLKTIEVRFSDNSGTLVLPLKFKSPSNSSLCSSSIGEGTLDWLVPPSESSMKAELIAGTTVRLSWERHSRDSKYALRIDASPGYDANCQSPDICMDVSLPEYTFNIREGQPYRWWVHSVYEQLHLNPPQRRESPASVNKEFKFGTLPLLDSTRSCSKYYYWTFPVRKKDDKLCFYHRTDCIDYSKYDLDPSCDFDHYITKEDFSVKAEYQQYLSSSPLSLSASCSNGVLTATWPKVSNAINYELRGGRNLTDRPDDNSWDNFPEADKIIGRQLTNCSSDTCTFTTTNIQPNEGYFLWIHARTNNGISDATKILSAVRCTSSQSPSFQFTSASCTNGIINISWTGSGSSYELRGGMNLTKEQILDGTTWDNGHPNSDDLVGRNLTTTSFSKSVGVNNQYYTIWIHSRNSNGVLSDRVFYPEKIYCR